MPIPSSNPSPVTSICSPSGLSSSAPRRETVRPSTVPVSPSALSVVDRGGVGVAVAGIGVIVGVNDAVAAGGTFACVGGTAVGIVGWTNVIGTFRSWLRSSRRVWSFRVAIAHCTTRQSIALLMTGPTLRVTVNDPPAAYGMASPSPIVPAFYEIHAELPLVPAVSTPPPHGLGITPGAVITQRAT